jgi:DNA-3-methyladenine glycosylase II
MTERRKRSGVQILDEKKVRCAAAHLAKVDQDLGRVHRQFGPPPLWPREPGFPTLIHIILEQQVSLASAKAAFDKLVAAIGPVTASAFLTLNDIELRQIGFSRQKTSYVRRLADAVVGGELDLASLNSEPDDDVVRRKLVKLKGIGQWTADIYLLMALKRPDVWPAGDLALAVAFREVKQLDQRPDPAQMMAWAEPWRPYRAVAARILWHHYLSTPRRKTRV